MAKAASMGPFKRPIKVQWRVSQPVYISVMTHAGIRGVGVPGHTATLTLSPAAIAAGATMVLNINSETAFWGVPEFYGLHVMKFPKPLKENQIAFSLALAGSLFEETFPPEPGDPVYFCGHYSSYQNLTYTGGVDVDFLGLPIHFETWQVEWNWSNPDGSDSGVYHLFGPAPPDTPLPGFPPGGGEDPLNFEADFLSYRKDGDLINTGLPCAATPNKLVNYPFGFPFQVAVNPVKDHIAENPGIAHFYDAAAAVRLVDSNINTYPGEDSQSWQVGLEILGADGVSDTTINFAYAVRPFSTLKPKTKIPQVYPVTAYPNLRYDRRIRFRLPGAEHFGTSFYTGSWDADVGGPGPLYAGSPPPILSYDPTA